MAGIKPVDELPSTRLEHFFDDMEHIGQWRDTHVKAFSDVSNFPGLYLTRVEGDDGVTHYQTVVLVDDHSYACHEVNFEYRLVYRFPKGSIANDNGAGKFTLHPVRR